MASKTVSSFERFFQDEFTNSVADARMKILRNEDYSCPATTKQFFLTYSDKVGSSSRCIEVNDARPIKTGCNDLLMVSESGVESTLLKLTYKNATTYTMDDNDWWALPKYHKREFQLACQAMSMGVKHVYIGISLSGWEADMFSDDKFQFEHTISFMQAWNSCMPTKVVYPFINKRRLDIYKSLHLLNVDLASLSTCSRRPAGYCGNCVKCAEHYFVLRSFGVFLPTPSRQSLKSIVEDSDDFYGARFNIQQSRQWAHFKELTDALSLTQ